jgi:hypothetical protein
MHLISSQKNRNESKFHKINCSDEFTLINDLINNYDNREISFINKIIICFLADFISHSKQI